MIDGVIAGTGNSRNLKSVSNFLTLYPTYADFVSALIAGTLPIDLNGINEAGWTTLATALSKANLLSDTTAAAINALYGTTPTTPNNALAYITSAAQTLHDGRTQIATGSYTGSGLYGISHPNSLTFSFVPKFVIVFDATNTSGFYPYTNSWASGFLWAYQLNVTKNFGENLNFTLLNETLSWYTGGSDAVYQLNTSGNIYKYIVIG